MIGHEQAEETDLRSPEDEIYVVLQGVPRREESIKQHFE